MIGASELIIADSGRVYHLDLLPGEVAEKIILVGDPSRVDMIASYFDTIECNVTHREFHTITGTYKGKRVTAMSSGISSDNIDILMTELDALFNVDFATREIKEELTSLEIVRLGTCGVLQAEIALGDFVLSRKSIGLDGVINFYYGSDEYRDTDIEDSFISSLEWHSSLPRPYVVTASEELSDRFKDITVDGFTACGGGFFAPQGRTVRLKPIIDNMVERISDFDFNGLKITNFEMEGAALTAMCNMMGHKTTTICLAIAHRIHKDSSINYNNRMSKLIEKTLDILL